MDNMCKGPEAEGAFCSRAWGRRDHHRLKLQRGSNRTRVRGELATISLVEVPDQGGE